MPFTLSLRNQIMNHLFSKDTLWSYTFEIGVRTNIHSHGRGGKDYTEPADKEYKRVVVPKEHWSNAANGIIFNREPIIFEPISEDFIIHLLSCYEHDGPNWSLANCHITEGFLWLKYDNLVIKPGDCIFSLK